MPTVPTALVVDDDQAALFLFGRYLESFGVCPLLASSGAEALEILRHEGDRIGLVLLDIAMPHMNGYEVCRAIRDDLGLVDLLVVAVTARTALDVEQHLAECSIDAILSKPFTPDAFKDILRSAFRGITV